MSDPAYDFKTEATALLKSITPKLGTSINPALSLAAVEAALREAFRRGQGAKTSLPSSAPARSAQPAKHNTSAPSKPVAPLECSHHWQETDLDDRTLDIRCTDCGLLQREVQERCDHYFVDTGGGSEVCLACRKPKRARR